MVIARMKGGLGNQFFIYAAARAFALRQGVPLFLEVNSGFNRDPYKRSYLLDQYPVQVKKVGGKHTLLFLLHSRKPGTAQSTARFFTGKKAVFVTESSYEELKHSPSSVFFLDGYWQSEAYFRPFGSQIKRELTWKEAARIKKSRMGKMIRAACSVAIHGRLMRSYASDGTPVTQQSNRDLPASYYQQAITRIAEEVSRPHFFLFSDNPERFEHQLDFMGFPYTVVHQHREDFPGADLVLMSACRHFIISNSTYSWWGAYLAEFPDKKIVSPPARYWDHPQALPTDWISLNV